MLQYFAFADLANCDIIVPMKLTILLEYVKVK